MAAGNCWPDLLDMHYNYFTLTLLPSYGSNYQTTSTYQFSETNVMHFLFNLLRIKGLYMF
jgi:hypothetical protein